MPLRLKTRCRHPGCGRAVRGPYCDEHQRTRLVRDRGRGSSTARGYDSKWQRIAQARRELDCYLCQECLKKDRLTVSSTVDHIIPIEVRPDWRLEIDNTQVLCNECHSMKTKRDERVYGYGAKTCEQMRNRTAAMQLVCPPREVQNDADCTK